MKIVIAAFAALALALPLALPVASAESAGYWRQCGDQPHPGAGWYNVKAHGIGCGGARAVAKHWRGPETSPYEFNCFYFNAGYELGNVVCRRDRNGRIQKVRFQVGA